MISFNNVTKTYGGQVLYKDASFILRPNDKIGLVGPNGAGKTTVFRILAKEEGFDSGTITVPEKVMLFTDGDATKLTVGAFAVPPVVILVPGCTRVIVSV